MHVRGQPVAPACNVMPKLAAHVRVERVRANPLALSEDVSFHRCKGFRTAERARQPKARDIQSKDGKVVVMNDLVVPRGTGTIVSAVLSLHLFITSKPIRIVV